MKQKEETPRQNVEGKPGLIEIDIPFNSAFQSINYTQPTNENQNH